MGETQMGRYKFSSWTLHMASIIIFSTLWGIALHEWKDAGGCSPAGVTWKLFNFRPALSSWLQTIEHTCVGR